MHNLGLIMLIPCLLLKCSLKIGPKTAIYLKAYNCCFLSIYQHIYTIPKKFLCKIHYLQWNVIHYIAELLWFLILYIFVDDWTDVSLIVICNFFDNIVLPIHKQSDFKVLSLISLMKLALAVNFLYEIISLLDYSSLLVEVAYYQ